MEAPEESGCGDGEAGGQRAARYGPRPKAGDAASGVGTEADRFPQGGGDGPDFVKTDHGELFGQLFVRYLWISGQYADPGNGPEDFAAGVEVYVGCAAG